MFEYEEKREIADAIYEAELTADMHGGSVSTVLLGYAQSIRKLEPKKITFSKKIENIARRIIKGDRSERVYAPYIDKEMIYILKEASEAGVRSGQIIKEYLPIKKMATNIRKKIIAKLKIPIIIAFGASAFMFYVVGQFKEIINGGMVEGDLSSALWVADYYLPISLIMLLAIAVPLLAFPHKIPKLKSVFIKTDAMLSIVLVKILNHIGQSPIKIIPFINQTFDLNIPVKNKDIEGLAYLLYHAKYTNIYQASKLTNITSLKRDFPKILEEILEEIKTDVELSSETIGEAIGNIATVLVVVPMLPAVYVMGSVIKAILAQAGLAGM